MDNRNLHRHRVNADIGEVELSKELEEAAMVALMESLQLPREAIEEYKQHLREQGPRRTFRWERDGEANGDE